MFLPCTPMEAPSENLHKNGHSEPGFFYFCCMSQEVSFMFLKHCDLNDFPTTVSTVCYFLHFSHTIAHLFSIWHFSPASAGIINRNNTIKTYNCWIRWSELVYVRQYYLTTAECSWGLPPHNLSLPLTPTIPHLAKTWQHFVSTITGSSLPLLYVPKSHTNSATFCLINSHPRTKNSKWVTQDSDTSMNDASDIIIYCLYGRFLGSIKN